MTCSTRADVERHDEAEHRSAANRAIAVSAIGLGFAGVFELVFALLTHSVGLLGDALHNLSDVSTSALVFIGFRMSRRRPNPRFPYGYDRAEDLAGLGVALVIWASAVFAGVESYLKLVNQGGTQHLGLGMTAAAIAIVANQVVARYKGRVGLRIQSATLLADARHSWLDAISSLGALIGLVGVAIGWPRADAVAGLAVTLFIAHVGYEVTGDLLKHLMDGVDDDLIHRAETAARDVPGVTAATAKARWTGRQLRVQVLAVLEPHTELVDADHVSRHVDIAVRDALPEARHVEVTPTSDVDTR
jgi:cation diffusion facilitator family transporter